MDLWRNETVQSGFSLVRNEEDISKNGRDSADELSRDVTEFLSEVDEEIPAEHYRQIGKRLADVSFVVLNAAQKDVGAVGDLFWGTAQAIFKSVLLCVTAVGLNAYPARSTGEVWPPFVWKSFGPENSMHFTDPYTFLHFESGLLSYLLWGWWGNPGTAVQFDSPITATLWQDYGGLILALAAAFLWEVLENSDYVVSIYAKDIRQSFYKGDSAINIFGDILSLGVAYNIAKVFGSMGLYWVPAVWFIMSEIFSAVTFRDNLTLAIINTVAPQKFITDWQNNLIPNHLKGVMKAGYWENKVRDPPAVFLDKLVHRGHSFSLNTFQKFTHHKFQVSQRFWKHMGKVMEKRKRI